ncbi:hypothetical protein sS8_3460 [Methylocaldum marinum]|uniref:Uncharacterized protein n=1 Tax=Methylocaldum marinum TaxID=1432792 RepID=A0A250KUV4_9GAMM|nr:hypothetical protein [Methylocaldum marinum]BBA35397.1 hypothetical protein sS8_3460 [Methylocaldum marinum]
MKSDPPKNQKESDLEIYTFHLRFEGSTGVAVETSGYWCDAGGRLIEGADTVNGKLVLALTEAEVDCGRLLIVPISTDAFQARRVTADTLLAFDAFEPKTLFDPALRHHVLPEIPESLWRLWFLYRRLAQTRPRPSRAGIRSW